MQIRFTLSL